MLNDFVKLAILLPLYFLIAPLVGMLIRPWRPGQKALFAMMIFLTVLHYRHIAMSLAFPIPFYRGHTRGYECTLMEMIAVSLLFAGRGRSEFRARRIPPGFWLWMFYCLMSSFSILNAANPSFALMAIVKFSKIFLVYAAAYHFIREEEDVCFFLKCIAWTLIFQALICLIHRYVLGAYQVFALFEHQNSLTMYSYMLGLLMLAAGLSNARREVSFLCIGGFLAAGLAVLLSLSRMGLLCFAAGSCLVVLLSFWDRITKRRMQFIAVLGVVGALVFLKASHTILERFDASNVNLPSKATRSILNEASRKMLADHPLIGVGWNNYGVMINPPYSYGKGFDIWEEEELGYTLPTEDTGDLAQVRPISESWYYLMLAETGVLGTGACFLFFLTTLFWLGRNILFYRRTFLGAVAIGLFTGIGMNYVQSNVERVLTQPKNLAMWLICLGVAARMEWWRRQGVRDPSLLLEHFDEDVPVLSTSQHEASHAPD